MARFSFEGDLVDVSEIQLEYIDNVLQKHGFKSGKVTIEPVGKVGDNYVASVKRITVENGDDKLTMVGKLAPNNEVLRKFMNIDTLFRNEHLMYYEYLPRLHQLQIDAGIPEEQQLKYAKCYGSFAEKPDEIILLEDLRPENFKMLDRFQSLSNECVKSVLKNFAILHSLSYVLKDKEPEFHNNFKASLFDPWSDMANRKETKDMIQGLQAETLSVVQDNEHIEMLKDVISNIFDGLAKISKTDFDYKYAVLAHGDGWTNNIMFRFENDELLESILIDYQIPRSISPVYDLMYMIFNATDYETRRQNYHDWIEFYHTELDKYLSYFNYKADDVYPRSQLDVDLKRYAKIIMGLCVFLGNMLIRKSDDAAKFMELMKSENMAERTEEIGIDQLDEESANRFKDRLTGLINSFKDFELL